MTMPVHHSNGTRPDPPGTDGLSGSGGQGYLWWGLVWSPARPRPPQVPAGRMRRMGMMASSITLLYHHIAGMARNAATGTVQGRSVRAPQTTTSRAIGQPEGERDGDGLGRRGLARLRR